MKTPPLDQPYQRIARAAPRTGGFRKPVLPSSAGFHRRLWLFASLLGCLVSQAQPEPQNIPPEFTLHPESQTIQEGQTLYLSIEVTGSPPVRVQWFKGQEPIPDATHETLPIIRAALRDSGAYYVHAWNDFGAAISSVAPVEVVKGDFQPEPGIHFFEDFELPQALDDWFADAGAWEIGEPTSGPGGAYAGDNCAATVLGGNYAGNTSSRLVSPPVTVPQAFLQPRLRFWQWFNFESGDGGTVQIRPVGTPTWIDLSPTYAATSSGAWTRPSLDLSPWAGQAVELAFWFASDTHWNSAGWYIDDVAITTGPTPFNNPEGFELGMESWQADAGTWEIGTPTSGPGGAYAGDNCAATVLGGNYAGNISSRLVSPPVTVPPAVSNPRLRFWHWYSFASGDGGTVQIRPVGTPTWIDLSPTYTATSSGVWTRPSLDLSPWAGQAVELAFWFASDTLWNSAGWYIDEVRLLHDFAMVLQDAPIVRAQDTACVPLGIAASLPGSTVSFTLRAPPGHLGEVDLDLEDCWSESSVTAHTDSEWLVTLRNSCPTTPTGLRTVGTLCIRVVSARSAFVPLDIEGLVVTHQDGSIASTAHAWGSRAVVIAQEPMIEGALIGPNRLPVATVYGVPGTNYEIQHNLALYSELPWTLDRAITMPANMFATYLLGDEAANAPRWFLRAREP